jgi:Ni/Co efflux regulator RcnB
MKHLMTAALALSLLGGGSALAQDNHDHGGDGSGDHHGGAASGGGQRSGSGGAGGGQRGGGAPGGAPGGAAAGAAHGGTGGYTGAQGGVQHGGSGGYVAPQGGAHGGYQGGGYQGGGQQGFRGGQGSQSNGAHGRYSPNLFPRVIRPEGRYHWRGEWFPQPGFYYHRWAYGERLPYGWWGSQWFIQDYDFYGLPPAPYGYEWVRVGPDALLIDLRTGMVVESAYGLFY